MIKVIDDDRLIAKVCDMYYLQDMSQKDIAAQLGLSRPTISRLIANGRDRDIVKITIDYFGGADFIELERALETRFGLREVIICASKKDADDQKDAVGEAAAQYLRRIVRDGSVVGVSMGTTLSHIAPFIREESVRDVCFVPLIGGLGPVRLAIHSNYISEQLAHAFGGENMLMHAPARVSTAEIREALLKDENISRVIEKGSHPDIALVGIGVPNKSSAIMATGYCSSEEMARMRKRRVVGDICMQFFDIHGSTKPFVLDNNVVGVDIRKLRTVPCSIGVSCGTDKAPAVLGAIRGRFVNTLILDEELASALIAADDEQDNR